MLGIRSALSTVALAFAVLSLTRSAVALGVVLAGSRLPQIIFALLGGALGDRFSRRLIMLSNRRIPRATSSSNSSHPHPARR